MTRLKNAIAVLLLLLIMPATISCTESETSNVVVISDTSEVVVTKTGEKYHKSKCRYVKGKNNTRTITKSDAKSKGYTACNVCKP